MVGMGMELPAGRNETATYLVRGIHLQLYSANAGALLKELALEAADRVIDRGAGDEGKLIRALDEGQAAFATLDQSVRAEANFGEITAFDIREVLKRLCPLWPICIERAAAE